jgi:hypothetical protein
MQRTINDVLLDLLHIIKYPNNKQKFVKEFEELNHGEALVNMFERLPGPIKVKIKVGGAKPELIKKYIDPQKYAAEVTHVSSQALVNFINVVSPLLTLDQKQEITKLLQK